MPYPGFPHADSGWQGAWGEQRTGHRVSRRARLLFPVVVSLVVQVPSVFIGLRDPAVAAERLGGGGLLLALLLAIAGPLSLLAARRFPGPVVAFVTLAAATDLMVRSSDGGPPYIALAFAIVSAVVRGARPWAWISVASGWIGSLIVATVLEVSWSPFRIAITTLGILLVFGIAESVRTRKDRLAALGLVTARRRQDEVQAERVRIARELHDVLAHSLSQINVQAGVGLHLMDTQPLKAKEAFASIKETSKSALDEVRSVLGILRAEGTSTEPAPLVPEPDLARIPALADSVRAQGVAVTVTGEPARVPKATQLAMYRIVQESLTNVVRHAHAAQATVRLGQDAGYFTVDVTDDGTTVTRDRGSGRASGRASAHPDVAGGRGLLGMRERAELLGGSLEAGPLPSGGFAVSARIPIGEQGDSA